MNNKRIIYIAAPAKNTSGGPESLFQLGKELQLREQKVMFYFYGENKLDIPEKFKQYGNFEVTSKIVDSRNNILIVPESYPNMLNDFKNIQKVIWWLSVDFYEVLTLDKIVSKFCAKYHVPNSLTWAVALYKRLKKGWQKVDFLDESIIHLYNCEYVKDFLLNNGVKKENTVFLAPPLSDEYFLVEEVKKENIVAYNPAKGYEYTKSVIKLLSQTREDIKFVPIVNMTSVDVAKLLNKAKVYLDLGFFPGPDRIPRQAVLTKTNVITSLDGSAANFVDTPIPPKYKFDKTDYSNIAGEIITNIDNYEVNVPDFDDFRDRVLFEKRNFNNEIEAVLRNVL